MLLKDNIRYSQTNDKGTNFYTDKYMDKTEEKEANLERLKKFTVGLLRKEFQDIIPLCDDKMIWKVNEHYGNMERLSEAYSVISKGCLFWNLRNISFFDFEMIPLRGQVMLIRGKVRVEWRNGIRCMQRKYDLLMMADRSKALYVQMTEIQRDTGLRHEIKAVNDCYYFLEESEVLYIEANHNHVIWHCVDNEIESGDSLQHLETILSDDFVRIQRGYLVNKKHVKCLRRCEAIMRNGDRLPIPSKKYVSVRKLIEHSR